MSTVSDVTTVTYSGDLRVDSLLYSTVDWNFLLAARTTLFYTFDLSVISTVSPTAVTTFNAAQKASAIAVLNYASSVTGIVFVETPSGAAADFHFGDTNIAGASTTGLTHTAESYSFTGGNVLTSYSAEAFIFLDNVEFLASNTNPASGTIGYEVLLHEVGHALGLGHPFDGAFQLPTGQDNTNNTVMSYTHVGGIKSTFQAYDLLALRWIYGEDGLRGSFGFNSTNGPSLTLVPSGDTTAPTVSGFSPADELSNVAVGSNIVVTFNEPITRGTGSILLKNGLGTTIETYNAATSPNLSISSNTLTIDPTSLLANGTVYFLEFGSGNIQDIAGNAYAGTSSYNFSTVALPNHTPTGAVQVTGLKTQGATLSAATISLSDADGLGSFSYQWMRGSTVVLSTDSPFYKLGQSDVGKTISVRVNYVDGLGKSESVLSEATAQIANSNDLPSGSVSIVGTPKVGALLIALNNLADLDGLGVIHYQWLAAGSNITGATGSTFTPTFDQLGKTLSVVASYTDGFGASESKTSSVTIPIVSGDTTPPTVSIGDNVAGVANLLTGNIAYLLSFNESVSGLELSDFTIVNGTSNSLTGSAKSWTINVTPAPNIGSGVVSLTLKSGAVRDLSGNLNLSVLSSSQAIDTVAPIVLNFKPADETNNITTDSNIILTFSEAIQRGNASILLKNGSGTVIESFDAGTSNRLSISGSALTINPSADLLDSSEYRIEFASASVKDLAGNAYAGSNGYNFSTAIPIIMTGTIDNDNFVGDAGNDTLSGAEGNDIFKGNGGNDLLDGGNGLDLARFNGKIADYTLSQIGASTVVQANSGTDGKDTLQTIERLQFSDNNIAFDILGNAGQAYRLYQAAFDRRPDLAGLGYWINDMDKGSSLTNVAGGFFQSPEFRALYGSNPDTTTLITNFYKNVLHRAPDQAGFDYWANELNNNIITPAGALASFCESTENQAQVIGSIQNGIEYSPWLV